MRLAGLISWGPPQVGVALAEVVEVARPLAALGIALPPLDQLASFPGNKIDERLVELFRRTSTASRRSSIGGWPRLLRARAQWEVSISEMIELVQPLVALGLCEVGLGKLLPEMRRGLATLRPAYVRVLERALGSGDDLAFSCWDLACAGSAEEEVSPVDLLPLVKMCSGWGVDVQDCDEFIEFCRRQMDPLPSLAIKGQGADNTG